MWELRGSDLAAVREQLGRDPLTRFAVVARCAAGHPLVIRNHPLDAEGKPFPTLYWLTCPEAVKAVARLESEGWIKRLDEKAAHESGFAEELERAHREYAEERARIAPEAGAWGGVGGTRTGVKCLHAHYANHVAGGADPIGAWVASEVEPVHPRGNDPIAVIDMGTNSTRLLIAEPRDGRLVERARDMVITRLGTRVDAERRLDPSARERTLQVLERYTRRAAALGAEGLRIGCTSAVRDAGDAESLLRDIRDVTGADPQVLTGQEEAKLTFLGATADLDAEPPWLVFDIGGGSTELVRGREQPTEVISVDVGSVRLTERVQPADPATRDDVSALRRLAAEELAAAVEAVPASGGGMLIGVAGTTTTVQAIALGLDRYDPEVIHGSELSRDSAEAVAGRLAEMTTAERRALPVMPPGREDVILAGSQILLEVMERWGFDRCIVSERDILDGLALEMVRETFPG